ncbi:MAG: hypothetical protein AB2L14_24535 [Candidatus Xenobiia bacterium LiM19]
MAENDRRLILKVEGSLSQDGKVPLALLSKKLSALQDMFSNIGSALAGGGRRGTRKTEVTQACTLLFVQANPGSLEIATEVQAPSQLLLPEFASFGERALSAMKSTIEAILHNDDTELESLFPSYGPRVRILRSAERLFPEEESDYSLSIRINGSHSRLEASHRDYIRKLSIGNLQDSPGKVSKTITGILYLIEVETGTRNIGVIVNNRKIPCFYASEYEEIIRDLIPGSVVEVDGFATLNDRGEIETIETLTDIRPAQLVPLYKQQIHYSNKILYLKDLIKIDVDFQDGVWIYHYQPLGITGYGATRKEAQEAFLLDFISCWDLIAQEIDENLTADALSLKTKLLSLVEKSEVTA